MPSLLRVLRFHFVLARPCPVMGELHRAVIRGSGLPVRRRGGTAGRIPGTHRGNMGYFLPKSENWLGLDSQKSEIVTVGAMGLSQCGLWALQPRTYAAPVGPFHLCAVF